MARNSELCWSVFDGKAAGYPPSVHESDAVFLDDVPVADAVEQQRPTDGAPLDEDRETGVPPETTASDWQKQRATVLIDPELEEPEQQDDSRWLSNRSAAQALSRCSIPLRWRAGYGAKTPVQR